MAYSYIFSVSYCGIKALKGLMLELDPICVDWTIYDINLRHLTLQYSVSKFIDICMVACTKKLFFMI